MTLEPANINVTDLRAALRHVLENAHSRRRCYVLERAGQPMAVIIGIDQYEQLMRAAQPAAAEPSEDLVAAH